MKDHFYASARFEDQIYVHKTTQNNVTTRELRGLTAGLKQELEAAVISNILVLYESLRVRSLYNAIHHCPSGPNYATSLNRLWILLHPWGKLSKHVLKVRKPKMMALDSALPMEVELLSHDFLTMTLGNLIEPAGVLL